ncbi:Uncharacterized protein HSRCO_0159 [Halanaeroarchaeum sp. HSR-CO]|uniref:hypothetical protein n=1 Tax=Halanaeroarchaeum sp. HSR-CO TaxID=2866382 RepID=UPI00217EE3A8|nr:hypothetical protein [Halanaeroarchaeum sp. HSR-CO]UWG46461.1 Uncharacterized protein HSRCO_0159 [Halanaeroarchaeum sp. HSR-CO]
MSALKTLSFALAVVAVTGLLVGSIGFGSVAAERGVSVAVVDDDSAYVGYESSDTTVADGDRVAVVTVTNRLFDDVSVTNVSVESESVTFADLSEPTLAPGEAAAIEGTVDCSPGDAETVEVTVTLEGEGVTAAIYGDTVTREFAVSCADTTPSATYLTDGDVELDDSPVAETDVTYWTTSTNDTQDERPFTEQSLTGFQTNQTLQSQVQGSPSAVALYVPAVDVTYVHPEFDRENETIDSWEGGDAQVVDGELDLGS